MSYYVKFDWIIHEDNPDSLIDDVAWRATIYTAKHESIMSTRHSGSPDHLVHHSFYDAELLPGFREFVVNEMPDSIDPLYDWIHHQIKDNLAEATF